MYKTNEFSIKIRESIASVIPITVIVAALCLFLIPVNSGLMLSFVIGSIMIIVGMTLFNIGSELSMTRIGSSIGAKLTKSRRLWLIITISLLLGTVVTIAEPDLSVLASNVPGINSTVLIITISVGVGIFLLISMLRILFSISLKWLILGFYGILFVLAVFVDEDMLSVAFDAGGVTTGPMTVPFIMALGVGVASIRSDANAKSDSFGLVALCSIGPIISVMVLSFIYDSGSAQIENIVENFENTVQIGRSYLKGFPECMGEVAFALLPIFLFFLVFQFVSLRLKKVPFVKILIGIVITYVGLVLFLTGVNVGFSSLGYELGNNIADSKLKYLLIPIAMLMGWFIINAEPAVHVLNGQVLELSAGAISEKAMGLSLSIAVAAANGIAMLRVLTGISIMYFVVPGYLIALLLSFVVPPTFTAIAFDSGGVASGPLTAAFMLPFAMGACSALGGNIMTDAFGLVALVAMMPLISVQVMGALYVLRLNKKKTDIVPEEYDDEVIELWEV